MPEKATEGFRDKSDMFTALSFVKPDYLHHSVYMLLGLKSGYVWVTDTRVNQYLYNVKVLDNDAGGVRRIFSSHARIIIEPSDNQVFHCWDQSGKNGDKEYSAANPFNLFMGKETTLSVDGNIRSSSYDDTGNQIMALSTSGSIWYLSWIESVTLRLKSCHNPDKTICCADYKYVSPSEFSIEEEQESSYTFDQNYQISTASSDGQIKLWNMHDLEYSQQFIVPKEECIYIAMH
jgi:WD40 repeat protein